MTFTRPISFAEAVAKLGSRNPLGSKLRTEGWRAMTAALSDRAFFSAAVEDVRFLENARGFLLDAVSGAKRTNERGETYYTMDRAKFVQRLQNYAVANGMGPTGPGDLQDIRSQTRLELIFDTQIKSARDYGYWKQGQDPDVLEAFPYQRFIRVADVRAPRARSERWEGVVRRKDDLDFWIMLNEDFRVPWGPWGFNSGMDVEDVAAEEAGEIIERNPVMEDVLRPSVPVRPVDREFNEGLRASVRGMSPEARQHIQDTFGGQVRVQGDEFVFTPGAPAAPPAPTAARAREAIDRVLELTAKRPSHDQDYAAALRADQEALRLLTPPPNRRGTLSRIGPLAGENAVRFGSELVERFSVLDHFKAPIAFRFISQSPWPDSRSMYHQGVVYLRPDADLFVVAHELMHWLEDQNPALLKASQAFLRSRTADDLPELLRDLTGVQDYRDNEFAWRDRWVERGGSVYTGKIYPDATEILSTGIERLIKRPTEFAAQDPDFFAYVVRALWNEL